MIPDDADATFNWYLGKNNSPTRENIINGAKTLLSSIHRSDDVWGKYEISIQDLKSQMGKYNIIFFQAVPGTSGDALNYEASEMKAVISFNDEIHYTN